VDAFTTTHLNQGVTMTFDLQNLFKSSLGATEYFLSVLSQISAAADRPSWQCFTRTMTQMSTVSVIKCDRWRSPVYHTDCPPELTTAPETISRSRDTVGAHQHLNGSRDLTRPLLGIVCHLLASTCYLQLTYHIWSLYLHSPFRYGRRYKMSKMGWFRVLRVIQGHWK